MPLVRFGSSMRLALPRRVNDPSFLKKAIRITNRMLRAVDSLFKEQLRATNDTSARFQDVTIEFRKPRRSHVYGWTGASGATRAIYVNRVFRDRLAVIAEEGRTHEFNCIVFMIAIVLLRKCVRLVQKWQREEDASFHIDEAVELQPEQALLHGTGCLQVQKSETALAECTSRAEWTMEMAVLNVVIENHITAAKGVVPPTQLQQFLDPGALDDASVFQFDLLPYSTRKGATLHRPHKRQRNGNEDSSRDSSVLIFSQGASSWIHQGSGEDISV